jgi:uncharacterized protein (TIGR03067 family)
MLAAAAAWAQDSDAAKQDQDRFQGEWTMVSGERDAQPFPAEFTQNSKRVASGDEVTVIIQGQLFMKAKFKLDPSKTPKTIDYQLTAGNYAGNTQLGIYELKDDTVKFCFGTPGKPRPLEFATKPGDGQTLSVWKKAKVPAKSGA